MVKMINYGNFYRNCTVTAYLALGSLLFNVATPEIAFARHKQKPQTEVVQTQLMGQGYTEEVTVISDRLKGKKKLGMIYRQFRVIEEIVNEDGYVTATKVITDIKPEDVRIYDRSKATIENPKGENITDKVKNLHIEKKDKNIALIVDVDVSISMLGYINDYLRPLTKALYSGLHPEDRFKIVSFAGSADATKFYTKKEWETLILRTYLQSEFEKDYFKHKTKTEIDKFNQIKRDKGWNGIVDYFYSLTNDDQAKIRDEALNRFIANRIPRIGENTDPNSGIEKALKGFFEIDIDQANLGHVFLSDYQFDQDPLKIYLNRLTDIRLVQLFSGLIGSENTKKVDGTGGVIFSVKPESIESLAKDIIAQLRTIYELSFSTDDVSLENCGNLDIEVARNDGHSYNTFSPRCNLLTKEKLSAILAKIPKSKDYRSLRSYIEEQIQRHHRK